MISIEKLRAVKRLVTHANCPDGVASALIIKDALPDVEVLFVKHGTEQHRTLEPRPGTLFCDFSPWLPTDASESIGLLKQWQEAGAIVLDHHPTQKTITDVFVLNGLGAYGENDRGECGAWLAYEHVWLPTYLDEQGLDDLPTAENDVDDVAKEVREFARLAGIRDTWKKSNTQFGLASEQAEILMFWGNELLEKIRQNRDSVFTGAFYVESSIFHPKNRHYLGKHLFEKKLEHARTAIGEAHEFVTAKGTRVLVFQGVTPTSDAAEILEQRAKMETEECFFPDIVAGFHYRVDAGKLQLAFSTRSHTGYDVGAFCKSKGGGGHSAAAGFTVEQSAEIGANPYAVFKLLLEEWEQGQ